MKKLSAKILTGLVLGSLMMSGTAFAADESVEAFDLDQIVVTATRTEKLDVDVPASTEILTQEKIKMSGATNAFEALSKVNGVEMNQYFPGGAPFTSMTSDINIRGFGGGTLVMVNGNPINLNNKYVIDAIPTEQIERIEVVKGGGAILYGSEAMAGVVNIITKKGANNSVTVGYGNRGQQKYNVNVGNDKLRVAYDLKKWGNVNSISGSTAAMASGAYEYNLNKNIKENFDVAYSINKNLDVEFTHFESDVTYDRDTKTKTGEYKAQYRDTYTRQDLAQINYKDDTVTAHAWWTKNKIKYEGKNWTSAGKETIASPTVREVTTLGADVQKTFKVSSKSTVTAGANFKHESLDNPVSSGKKGDKWNRNIAAVFAQLDQKFDDKNTVIISGRETWTTSASKDQKYHNFSGGLQYLHKLTENKSVYAGVTQSFIMPTFSAMYPSGPSAGDPNPDLKPMKGVNYEIGYKEVAGNHTWKFAAFTNRVKDNIAANWSNGTYTYSNEDFRNKGVEASLAVKASDKINYDIGFTIQNPENKNNKYAAKKDWQRKFGKYQLKGGVDYTIGKFKTALTASYVFDRYSSPSSSKSYKIDPYFLTTWTANYAPDKNSEFSLIVDNVLNRRDNMSNTMSNGGAYYKTPTSFLLSYTYKF
ncbi:MAG: TonB-dependent receptor [Phascolarctobacterium sp.]|nr:TonB-dependent receptor [Phascolarctobacterium sp.]